MQLRAEAPAGESDPLAATLRYDALVIAVGAGVGFFGVPGAEAHALPLKELRDARAVRQRLLRTSRKPACRVLLPRSEHASPLSWSSAAGPPAASWPPSCTT